MTGSGTASDPYLIYNVTDLQDMESDLSAYYELANDIDASATSGWNAGAGFVPIGQSSPYFTGNFNGNGYTISDLFINRPTEDDLGLFGVTNYPGVVIQNVVLTGVDITGDDYVGGLVGFGWLSAVTDCSVSGTIEGDDAVGGLVGEFIGGTASGCYSSGTLTANDRAIGGLIGYLSDATVTQCYSTANINGGGYYIGGLVGETDWRYSHSVSYCFATGNVNAPSGYEAGGLLGGSFGSDTVSNCYARGNVTSNADAGGLIGYIDQVATTVENSYSTGEVSSTASGGLIASNAGGGTITDCFWDTETSGTATSDGGTGKTTAEMKSKSTFRIADWDFKTIWSICPGINVSYPCLIGVTPSCVYVPYRHHPTHSTEPNRGKILSKMGSLK